MSSISENQIRCLELIGHVGDAIVKSPDIEATLNATVSLIQSMLEARRCSIMLLDREAGRLHMAAAAGIEREKWSSISVEIGKGYSGRVAETGEPILVEDTGQLDDYRPSAHSKYRTNSFICAPLKAQGQIVGVINVNDKLNGESFNQQDLSGITTLSTFIALALENAHLLLKMDNVKENLSSILDGLFIGVMMIDVTSVITHANLFAKNLFGVSEENCDGQQLSWMFGEELSAKVRSLIEDTILYQAPQSRQVDWASPASGKILPLAITTTLIFSEQHTVNGVVLIVDDHSLRREVAKLRRLDEIKENFIAMVSHELRTPLTTIKGALYLLESAKAGKFTDAHRKMIHLISQNTERLILQINNLLDVTYIDSKTFALVKREADVIRIVSSAVAKFQKIVKEGQLDISARYEMPELNMNLDPDKFPKIIENLLDNAVKFSKPGGQIEVVVETEGDACVIRVSDTGVGIPLGQQDRIFDRFFQSEHTITREAGGNGLGLYITKALVDLHRGQISLSRSSEKGSEFCVKIPIEKAASDK
jgi:PAS domain S-box-containing protein